MLKQCVGKKFHLTIADANFFVFNLILNTAKQKLRKQILNDIQQLHINLSEIMKIYFLSLYSTRECLFCHITAP